MTPRAPASEGLQKPSAKSMRETLAEKFGVVEVPEVPKSLPQFRLYSHLSEDYRDSPIWDMTPESVKSFVFMRA